MRLFLRDFDAEALTAGQAAALPEDMPPPPRTYGVDEVDRLIAEAREAALLQGREEGAAMARAEAEESQAARGAAVLETIAARLSDLLEQEATHRRSLERDVVDMLVDIGERIAPEFLSAYSADLAQARIRAGLRMAGGSAKLTIRVSPEMAQVLEPQLAAMAQSAGIDPAPRLVAEPALGEGEVRLDWDNGGLDYSLERSCTAVLTALREAAGKLNDDQGKVG
ncbi:FliH/SctL family protein [Aquicoccus sp. SU-CL01552]|uniref:FliH/SctL family protein n=1 Tax=Aquicoccus sp. SU-CL01552 TaxID=3127656 RepID=UPI00310C7D11